MKPEIVLSVVLREMTAIGHGWRVDWSDFDGRTLRYQLDELAGWAKQALQSKEASDFTKGTNFKKKQVDEIDSEVKDESLASI